MVVGKRLNQDIFPIVEKCTEPKIVAFIRFTGLSEVGRRIWQVKDWLTVHGLKRTGVPSCVYSLSDETPTAKLDCHAGEVQWDLTLIPGGEALSGNGVVETRRLEPELVLSTFHQGDTDQIEKSFAVLRQVLREEGYLETGPQREIYLFDVCHPKSRWKTEIQIPVQKIIASPFLQK